MASPVTAPSPPLELECALFKATMPIATPTLGSSSLCHLTAMSQPILSGHAHAGERGAPARMFEAAGSVCGSDNSENQNTNGTHHHSRTAAGVLPKPDQALLPTPPPLPRGVTKGSNLMDSSCSGSIPTRERCTATAVAETTTAVAVALSPPFIVSLPEERKDRMGRIELVPRDPLVPPSPLNHSAVMLAVDVPPPLGAKAVLFTPVSHQRHRLSIPRSLLHTSTVWCTPVAAVTIASRLLGNPSSFQQADRRANAHNGAAATGAMTAAMSPAQASVVSVPQTQSSLGVLVITNNRTGEGTTLQTASATSELLSARLPTEALTAFGDSVNGKAGAPHASATPPCSPPNTVVALLLCRNVACDGRLLADSAVTTAADLLSLPFSKIITASDTIRLTPATEGAGGERCTQSRYSRHRTTASSPDFRPPPLNDAADDSLTSLGSLSGSSLATGATVALTTSGSEPVGEGSEKSGNGGDRPSPRCCMVAVPDAKTTPWSALVADSLHGSLPALSATAAATAPQCGEQGGTTQRHVMDNCGPPSGDVRGRLSMSITEPLGAIPSLHCVASDAAADTMMATAPLDAVAQPISADTASRQPAAFRDQNAPSTVQPPLQAFEALLPPPMTKALMVLSAPFPAGEVLPLDGVLQSCSDDADSVLSSGLPLAASAASGAAPTAAGKAVSASLFDSSAGVVAGSSAMRRRGDNGALLVQQVWLAKQNLPCSPLSMRPDAFQESVKVTGAMPPATSVKECALSTSPLRAARAVSDSSGGSVILHDDDTTAPSLVPLITPGWYAHGVQCMSGGASDAFLLATVAVEPTGYAQPVRAHFPCSTSDTNSQPSHPASESAACRTVSGTGTGNGASTLTDTSATTQGDSQHCGDALDYRSTSDSDVRAHFPPMSLQVAACQEASPWCDQSTYNPSGSCGGDAAREPVRETASAATQGTPKEKRLPTPQKGGCVDVQLSTEADGTLMFYMVPESPGAFMQESRRVEREGCGGMISARSLSHQESRHSCTLKPLPSRSITTVVVQPFNSIGERSPIPSVATTALLSPAVACPPLTAPQSTSVPPSGEESLDDRQRCAAPPAQINTTRTSRNAIPLRKKASTPRTAACALASLSSIGSDQLISHHAAVTTDSPATVSQVPMTASGPPGQFVAFPQALSANTSKGSVAQSRVAARQAPSPMPTVLNPKLVPVVSTTLDVPAAAVTAGHFLRSGTPGVCAVDHAHHSAAALSRSPASEPPTLEREFVTLHALPMCCSTETACVARRSTTMPPSDSVLRNGDVSGDGGAARGGPNPPPSPSAASVMRLSARAISASPYNCPPMRTRLEALRTPRSTGHRRSSSGGGNERRSAEHAVSTTSVAPPYSFAYVPQGGQAQAGLCRVLIYAKSPPQLPSRWMAHTLPLPVRVAASPVTASSSTSRETTLLCRPLDVRDTDTERGAPSIIPGTLSRAGSSVSSPAASELLGVLTDWTSTQVAMSMPQRASQRETSELVMVSGATVRKRSTAKAPPVAAVAVSETEVQSLSRRAKSPIHMRRASDTAATSATMGEEDTRGASAAKAFFSNGDRRSVRAALQRDDTPSTAASSKALHTSLSTPLAPLLDNLLDYLASPPKGRRTPSIHSLTRAGEIPLAVGTIPRMPALRSATAMPSARAAGAIAAAPTAADATARHPLPRSLGPSWERMEPLPVGHLASATPTATPPMARTLPLHSVPQQMAGTPTAVPHRVPTPSPLPSPLREQLAPRKAVLTGHWPASLQHPAASGLQCQPFPHTTPYQGGKRGSHGFVRSATLAMPPAPPAPRQRTGGSATSTPHQGEVMWEVLHDTHGSGYEWPIPAPSRPISVASSCLQHHQLQTGCRSGLPRFLPFTSPTPDTMPTVLLSQTPVAAVRRTLSTAPGGHGGRHARRGPPRESPVAHRNSPSPRLWRRASTPRGRSLGGLQPHGRGPRTGDFLVVLPPDPDVVDGTSHAAAPCGHPTFSSPATTAAAAGEVGTTDDAQGAATTASPISAASPPLRQYTMHHAPISGCVGGRAGAAVAGGITSGCATAGQPLHRVAAASPVSRPGAAAATESATTAVVWRGSVAAERADNSGACQLVRQLRSTKSGQPPPSPAFPPPPSVETDSQSPPHDRGEAKRCTGGGPRSLPVGVLSTAFVTAAGQLEPRPRYDQNGAPLQRGDEGTNAALRGAGKGKSYYRDQRAPRLTRTLLDRLQRSYAAAADASSLPHRSPVYLPCKKALVADWRDTIEHCADDGNVANGSPAMPQRRRLSASSRGQRAENPATVLPRSGWSDVRSNAAASSPPPLRAIAGPTTSETRTESTVSAAPDIAAGPCESLYRQQRTSSSPDPVAPQPSTIRENRGAVRQAPNGKALPLLLPARQAQLHRLRRNLVEQPPGKSAACRRADTFESPPVALPEMNLVPAKVLATLPPQAASEHEQTPVLTAVISVPPTPRRVPWPPEGKGQGDCNEVQSATEICPRRGWSGHSIRNFLRGVLKQRKQRRGERTSLAH